MYKITVFTNGSTGGVTALCLRSHLGDGAKKFSRNRLTSVGKKKWRCFLPNLSVVKMISFMVVPVVVHGCLQIFHAIFQNPAVEISTDGSGGNHSWQWRQYLMRFIGNQSLQAIASRKSQLEKLAWWMMRLNSSIRICKVKNTDYVIMLLHSLTEIESPVCKVRYLLGNPANHCAGSFGTSGIFASSSGAPWFGSRTPSNKQLLWLLLCRFDKKSGEKTELFKSKDPISWKSRSSALVVIVIVMVDVVTVVVLEICISAADEEFVVVVVFMVVVLVLVLVAVEVCVSVVVTVVLVTVVVVMVVVVTVLVVIVVVVVDVTYSLGQRLFGIFTNHWPCGSAMEALYAVPLLS